MQTNENLVYGSLLTILQLKESHRKNLIERGFTQKQIEENGYKSFLRGGLTNTEFKVLANSVEEQNGSFDGIAGFYFDKNLGGWATTKPAILRNKRKEQPSEPDLKNAIAIPVRDIDRSLVAIKFRLDTSITKNKYIYFSSNKYPRGTQAKPAVHFPLHSGNLKDLTTIRVTEGELKADFLTLNTQTYTISIAGVGQWKTGVEAILRLPKIRKVILCPDADKSADVDPYSGKRGAINQVARAFASFACELKARGYEVIMEDWDIELGKGADDVIAAGNQNSIRTFSESELEFFVSTNGKPAFPHIRESKRGYTLLSTRENVKALCEFMGITFRYNELKHREEFVTQRGEYSRFEMFDSIVNVVKSKASEFGLPQSNIPEFIDLICHDNPYHPARDWVDSLRWDGVERFDDFCATLHVDKDWEQVKKMYLKRWLISGVAALYAPNFWTKICLVLVGQGSLGKTTWLNNLFGDISEEVFKDGVILDPSNKDSRMNVVTNWCIELGELGATFRKRDREELKALITERRDTIRLPYGRKSHDYKRQCFFAASVDQATFLTDHAGDIRFACLPVNSIDWEHGLDMQQVFAEIKEQYYEKDETWFFNQMETEVVKNANSMFRELDPLMEIIELAYGIERPDNSSNVRPRTASEILDELMIEGYLSPKDCSTQGAKKISGLLSQHYITQQSKHAKHARRFYLPEIQSKDKIARIGMMDAMEEIAKTLN